MAEVSKRSRWRGGLILVFAAVVWGFNAYKVAIGLQTMGLLDGLSAGMCLLIGPFLLFELWEQARGNKH